MQKWEYKSTYIALIPREESNLNKLVGEGYEFLYLWQALLEKELNRYGAAGWELVSLPVQLMEGEVAGGFVLFKRLQED